MFEDAFSFLTTLSGFTIYGAVLAMLVLAGVGFPVPEDITLLTAGYLSATNEEVRMYAIVIVSYLGVIGGDSVTWAIGYRFGEGVVEAPIFRRVFTRERMERAVYYFERYGERFILLGRFVPGARGAVFLAAGILKMPYRRFLLLDGSAAVISVSLFLFLGNAFADNIHSVFERVESSRHALWVVLLVVVMAIVAYQLYSALERRAAERAVRAFERAHPEAAEEDLAELLHKEAGLLARESERRKQSRSRRIRVEGTGEDEEFDSREVPMSIFKAYDIRGKVPEELDADLARRIGWAIGKYLGVDRMVIGRDVRQSSPELAAALCRGLTQAGVSIRDLGPSTTPLTNFAIGASNSGGGVMVTASHNPPEYNGFKISKKGAVPVYDDQIRRIGELAGEAPPGDDRPLDVQPLDVTGKFLEQTVGRAHEGGKHLRVVVDLSSGAATSLTPRVLEQLPHEFIVLNGEPDGTFPSHEPDPLKEENLEQARKAIAAQTADMGAVFDGDADRVVFLDEHGETVTGDLATLLIALDLLEEAREKGETEEKPVVFYDVRSSRIVRETLEKAGADPRKCRVGHAFIKTAMREVNGLCAGELSGHYYFRDNFYAENSDLALILLLNKLSKEGKSLSEVVAPYRCYYPSGEVNMEVGDKQAAIERVARRFSEGEQTRLDGLSVEFDDWWFNIRPSNTEPVLRLNVESTLSREDMERHRDEIVRLATRGK